MKKILFVAAAFISIAGTKAQTYLQGGLNLANITQTNN